VKLNAESKDKIMYDGKEHTYDPARRINSVASLFMSAQGGYPTTTFLDEKKQVISVVPGYMAADMMSNVLHYFAENHYVNTEWNAYLSSLSNQSAPK
jgi:thioredoxin-related protein